MDTNERHRECRGADSRTDGCREGEDRFREHRSDPGTGRQCESWLRSNPLRRR